VPCSARDVSLLEALGLAHSHLLKFLSFNCAPLPVFAFLGPGWSSPGAGSVQLGFLRRTLPGTLGRFCPGSPSFWAGRPLPPPSSTPSVRRPLAWTVKDESEEQGRGSDSGPVHLPGAPSLGVQEETKTKPSSRKAYHGKVASLCKVCPYAELWSQFPHVSSKGRNGPAALAG
jgi:hypothetical protein